MPTPSPATAYTVTPHNAITRHRIHRHATQHRHPPPHTPSRHTTPSPATAYTITPHNAVILREVAVSIVECQGHWRLRLLPWHAKMDSATSRGMTKLGSGGYFGNDGRASGMPTPSPATAYTVTPHNAVTRHRTHRHATQRRHTARSRSIHSGVPRPLASPAAALACKDGFRDFARNDEVGVRRVLRE